MLLVVEAGCSWFASAQSQRPSVRESTEIDSILERTWQKKDLPPNAIVSDETFVRRIYLDVVGRNPGITEIRAFLADPSPAKRANLIESLLGSEGYVNHMYHFWADLLRINSHRGSAFLTVPHYIRFVKESLRSNKPYDQFVTELVTAEGGAFENGAIGYHYRDVGMPLDNMANTVRVFLGTRIECAQCHDHPFDKWTRMDFYQMAAFNFGIKVAGNTSQPRFLIDRDREVKSDRAMDADTRKRLIWAHARMRPRFYGNMTMAYDAHKRRLRLPHDYQYDDAEPKSTVTEKVLFGQMPEIPEPGQRLKRFGEWLTAPDNPRFTIVIVNRLWKKAMGVGLIEPIDDMTDTTSSSQSELMTFLEKTMISHDYDVQAFQRIIFNTRAYQRESTRAVPHPGTEQPGYSFNGPALRRLSAEQIWDSLVTLINPTPEIGNWRPEQERLLKHDGKTILSEGLKKKRPADLLAMVDKIAQIKKENESRLAKLKNQRTRATKAGDRKLALQLGRNITAETRALEARIRDEVFSPVQIEEANERIAAILPDKTGMNAYRMRIGIEDIRPFAVFDPALVKEKQPTGERFFFPGNRSDWNRHRRRATNLFRFPQKRGSPLYQSRSPAVAGKTRTLSATVRPKR